MLFFLPMTIESDGGCSDTAAEDSLHQWKFKSSIYDTFWKRKCEQAKNLNIKCLGTGGAVWIHNNVLFSYKFYKPPMLSQLLR